eukprot:scaffold85606_cov58-Attheya_sp.AAC.1
MDIRTDSIKCHITEATATSQIPMCVTELVTHIGADSLKVRGEDITGLKRTLEKHQLTSRSWRCTPCVSAPNNMIQYLFRRQRMVN